MKQFDKLEKGSLIIFTKTPLGSYTKTGEVYLVEYKGNDLAYFRNVQTKGGTYDNKAMIEFAQFERVGA